MQTRTSPNRSPADSIPMEQVRLIFERAIQALELGREDEAFTDLQQVVALSPLLSVPHNNLGILHKRRGNLDKAIEEYSEAIRLKPDYAEAYNNLGIAYREKGQFQEAERAYRTALRLNPDLAETHLNLGILYELYLNKPAEAREHYRTYVRQGGSRKQEVEVWISTLEQKTGATGLQN